jgi:enamine deaminase RidA (YjgF/YER057c/UK114 family)
MSVYERLALLGISLPQPAAPVAALVPFVRSGNLLFLSGHIAKTHGKPQVGTLGAGLTTEAGKTAARGVAIELLGTLHAALGTENRRLFRDCETSNRAYCRRLPTHDGDGGRDPFNRMWPVEPRR